MDSFDYIVVGAGSAGCVLANRLSADPRNRVALIEEGGTNTSPFIAMAGGFVKIMGNPLYFRAYPVAQRPGMRKEMHAYGKGLGGSSAINGTWYLTGLPADYDGWVARGLPGWGWNEIARCFKDIESYRDSGAHAGRGRDGELEVTPSTYRGPVFDAIMDAAAQIGAHKVGDVTQPGVQGAGRSQYTVSRRGKRVTSYTAFVAPVRHRPNLTVITDCAVQKVVIENGRATGVLCHRNGADVTLAAAREVIVSAGVYGSPHLLQLSGIGPAEELAALGIPVVRDLPMVGRDLCDHQKMGISFDLANHPGTNREFTGWRLYRNALRYFLTRTGPLARVGLPVTALVSNDPASTWPEFQVAAAPFAMRTVNEMAAKPGSPITPRPGITFSGYHLRPKSRGRIALASADWRQPPVIHWNPWDNPEDQAHALELFRMLRRFAAAPALAPYVGDERMPGAALQTDEEVLGEVRKMVEAGLHGTGTCGMGTDPATSVTDARCRVHGVAGLRVVDCSIMPTPVSGNTNGPAMAVAARAAELILEDR